MLSIVPSMPDLVSATHSPGHSGWPTCTSDAQVECVESLTYTTASGTVTATDPGGELPAGAPLVKRTDPYVLVTGANPSDPMTTLGFSVQPVSLTELAPNVRPGLEDGTYSFVIRLGSYDPTQVGLSGEPVSITPAQRLDGTFTLSVVARPKPKVSVMSAASYAACKAGGWTCDGELGVVRNISGFVFQNTIPANRPLFRGMWVATNASEFGTPTISVLERKVSAKIAGPHSVPPGFPTTGLTMENGKGVNPAFYRFHLPYSVIEAMLSMAPAQIRSSITADMVKATITDAATQKSQPVSVVTSDTGMTVDLGITHFSEPNPEVVFYSPSQLSAQNPASGATTAPAGTGFAIGKKYTAAKLVTVRSGYKVIRTVVGSASRSVCSASGTSVLVKKRGTCSLTVSLQEGKIKKTLKRNVKVG